MRNGIYNNYKKDILDKYDKLAEDIKSDIEDHKEISNELITPFVVWCLFMAIFFFIAAMMIGSLQFNM